MITILLSILATFFREDFYQDNVDGGIDEMFEKSLILQNCEDRLGCSARTLSSRQVGGYLWQEAG